jgi:hypothetical protein
LRVKWSARSNGKSATLHENANGKGTNEDFILLRSILESVSWHLRVKLYRISCEQDFSIREGWIDEIFLEISLNPLCVHRDFRKKISAIRYSRIEKSCSHKIR